MPKLKSGYNDAHTNIRISFKTKDDLNRIMSIKRLETFDDTMKFLVSFYDTHKEVDLVDNPKHDI